ncbi:MAG: Ig-like domain-containing protein [Sulfurovum sp.]|nr:Ig-like domain-containing protein [Sulfurovum sp.]
MIPRIKMLFFTVILMLAHPLYADVINGYIERIGSGAVKDINCQNYTITTEALLDISDNGTLREVTTFTNNGTWDYGTGQILELAAWVNNGTVAVKPTQTGVTPNLEFTTLCGPISVLGTSDTDGDGISDADEGDNAVALGHGITLDQDGDGVYNFLDDDSDNDGLTDTVEGGNDIDTDGDGIPDYLDNSDSTPNSANDSSLTGNTIGDDVSIDILANDTLDDGSAAVADDVNVTLIAPNGGRVNDDGSVTVPGEGTWSYNASTGILTFSPIEGFAGNPTPISYILTEIATGLQSNPATVTVGYDAVEPVTLNAVDDGTIVITHYGANDINVLANDSFSGSVKITISAQPVHGTVEIAQGSDGVEILLYSPFANINKVKDSFVYTITDKNGNVSEATVRLDIQCASTQTSDGTAYNSITLFIMMLLTMGIGFYMIRKEEDKV